MPSLELISPRLLKRKFSIFQVFFSKSLKEFFWLKDLSFICFSKVGIFQRKESLLRICFDLDFNIYLEIFPIVFLCSKHLVFSHLSYHLYPIYMIFVL